MWSFSTKRRNRKKLRLLREHVAHLLHVDDDILQDNQKSELMTIRQELGSIDPRDDRKVQRAITDASRRVATVLPARKFATLREYADVFAVAMMVAFGIRGLFLQPFKIPTSSMQPTLFGIHFIERVGNHNPLLGRIPPLDYPLFSCRRAVLEIKQTGEFDPASVSQHSGLLRTDTRFGIGNVAYSLPGEVVKVAEYSAVSPNETYKAGKVLCDGWLSLGDHLFVDRFLHHLADMRRGDIAVFNTEGIYNNGAPLTNQGYYYIKRLAGLPGDTLKIVDQRLLVKPADATEFVPITELSGKFDKIYSFKGGYHGHTNEIAGGVPTYLSSPNEEFVVPEDCYFMLGDNSFFSSDSRVWGVVPRKNIVGKAFWVFWPFSRRWGPADRAAPLPEPTTTGDYGASFNMRLQ